MPSGIDKCCIRPSESLLDGMRVIDRGGSRIALVLDEADRLVGTLTDGDIRRAILGGAPLDAPIDQYICRKFVVVGPAAERAEVLDLMQARLLHQVPIVDGTGRLLGLHLLHEVIGAVERPNWAVIMAGGAGTRLRPLTEQVPKPMLKVAGRPILERLVLHLVSFGVKRIFLAINYKGQMIEDHFEDGSRFGCTIEYLRESEPLGTGGALALLPERSAHPLVILNGDLVTQVNIDKMLAEHTRGNYVATIGVRRYSHRVPFGCIELDGDCISRFEEKPVLSLLVNAGVYVICSELAARVPEKFFLITELFEECLERGEKVGAFEIDEDWIDVGQHEQLRKAREGTHWHDQMG